MSNYFQGVSAPGLSIFFEIFFVFATLPIPFWGILMKLGTNKDHIVQMCIGQPCPIIFQGVMAP
jgi:hypothetical protein